MIDVGRVQGSKETAKPLIVGKDTVYVHTNIEKIEKDPEGNKTDNLYAYDEVTYGLGEYIALQAQHNDELENTLDDLMTNVIPEIVG